MPHPLIIFSQSDYLIQIVAINSHGGGRVVRRCCVSYITGASNWYWLTVGQGLLSLKWVREEGECFYFFCFSTFFPVPLSSLSLSFISSTLSSISFLPFSGRRHKMTLKGWRVVKPQHNQYKFTYLMANSADPDHLASSEAKLIWIYTVCKCRVYPGPAGQGLTEY